MDENLGLVLKEQHLGTMFRIPSINYGVNQNGPSIIIPYNPIFVQVAETGFEVNSFPGAFLGVPKVSTPRKRKPKTACPGEFLPKCTTTFGKGRGVASGTWIRALSSVSAAINVFGGQKRLQSFAENSLIF